MRRLTAVLLLVLCPLVSRAAESLEKSRGFRPDQVYQFNGLDSVNLFNGNLNVTIPLGPAYPVDANLSYSFVLRYSGNLWQVLDLKCPRRETVEPFRCNWRYLVNRDNAGLGWFLSFGALLPPGSNVDAGLASSHWRYRAPDGAEHVFYETLHEPACGPGESSTTSCDAVDPNTFYSRDGSYLRLVTEGSEKIVEFPDGQRHRFAADGSGSEYRITSMETASSTLNKVQFTYEENIPAGTRAWIVTDNHGRSHRVNFRSADTGPNNGPFFIVSSVELEGFGGVPATWTFGYGLNGSNTYTAIGRPTDSGADPDFHTNVWFLSSILLPEGESYAFQYHAPPGADDESGVLLQMRLPTMGTIDWTYGPYPVAGGPALVGVTSKVLRSPTGGELGRTDYVSSAGKRTVERRLPGGVLADKTEHYFDDRSTSPHFGLPFSPAHPDSGRFLSTVLHDCVSGCTVQKRTYVRYELDATVSTCGDAYPCFKDRNRRVVSELTALLPDGSLRAGTEYSGFDGLGHYRVAQTNGNYTSGNQRTTYTNFNDGAGTYALTGAGERSGTPGFKMPDGPWILNTFTESRVSEGSQHFITNSCFEPATGFLLRQRVRAKFLSGTTDLLKVFTRKTNTGFVAREQHFGGDRHSVPAAHDCEAPLPAGNAGTYRIDHTYEAGALWTSRYYDHNGVFLPFLSVFNVIDFPTGMVWKSLDAAGLPTVFDYDRQFRLTTMSPPGVQPTHYEYVTATSATPAEVHVRTGEGPAAPELQYRFDGIGRLVRERRRMPDESWAIRDTAYDNLSRRISLSEWGTGTASPSRTRWEDFDAFGRARKVTASDGSVTTFQFVGNRLATRTQTVRTPEGDTAVSIAEESDRAGRLIQVLENSAGTAYTTTYGYDAANRLTRVTMDGQQRTFDYDGRGFLTAEVHPESGQTRYEYDARGHVVKKTAQSGKVLQYTYDAAERLRLIENGAGDDLKEFVYDRTSAGGDFSMGKLHYAVRHNRLAPFASDITVKETYTYAGPGGRVSKRRTTVGNGTASQDRTFENEYAYDTFGNVLDVDYPSCADCPQLAEPARVVGNTYARGTLTAVPGYASDIAYHPGGTLKSVRHRNADGTDGPLYTQSLKDDVPRPDVIRVEYGAAACEPPAPVVRVSKINAWAGETVTFDVVEPVPGAAYAWTVTNGTLVSGQGTREITVRLSCNDQPVRADVTVTKDCGASASKFGLIYVSRGWADAVGDTQEIAAGQSAVISARFRGTPPFTYRWSDETFDRTTSAAEVQRTVTPSSTTSYTLVSAEDAHCALDIEGVASVVTVTAPVGAPSGVVATALGPAQVYVSWTYGETADSFRVTRKGAEGSMTFDAQASPFTDNTAVPGRMYLYSVAAVRNGVTSAASARDVATTIGFANDPLVPGVTPVYAAHIAELRTAINALRAIENLGPAAFSGAPAPGTLVAHAHTTELRDALQSTRLALGLPPLSFGPPLASGVAVAADHIQQLRGGLK
ncbi:MAG TPA: hypothetical protein VF432_33640 [Thermoanaerobaculia bacterium]